MGAVPSQVAKGADRFEKQMKQAAKDLEFETAAMLRDEIVSIRHELAGDSVEDLPKWSDQSYGRRGRRPLKRKEPSSAPGCG